MSKFDHLWSIHGIISGWGYYTCRSCGAHGQRDFSEKVGDILVSKGMIRCQ